MCVWVLVSAACGSDDSGVADANLIEEELTTADMVGFWEVVGHTYVEYSADGSYVIGSPVHPEDAGTFELSGSVLEFTSSIDSSCRIGDRGVWSAQPDTDGFFTIKPVEDGCGWRRAGSTFPHRPTTAHYDGSGSLIFPSSET